MRHRRAGVHLSRTSSHRRALFSNLVAALLNEERIRTTDVKAKATRRLAERTITWARRVGDILGKKPEKRTADEKARIVHAVRMAGRVVRDKGAVTKLFDEIAPRYLGRHGGYTRIVKVGQRPGDAAEMSLLELIPADGSAAPAETKPEGKGKAAKAKAGSEKPAAEAKGKGKAPKAGKAEKAEKAEKAPAKKPRAKKAAEE